jgi:hypothetical protein
MGYTAYQITELLLKADKTLYRLGSVAYNDMFAEDSEVLDYERDIIFLYRRAVFENQEIHLGETILNNICERLSVKVNLYNYGKLTPIYSDLVYSAGLLSLLSPYVLKTTTLTLSQGLSGSTNFGGSNINISLDINYIQSQIKENYVHDQQVASSTWVVTHNMNKYPSVNIVDTANDEVTGEVRYNNLNQITITFTAAFSGKAYLN